MASSKLTRKTLTPGGTEPKKANKTSSFASGMKVATKPIAKMANTANKLVKSTAKTGASITKGAGKAIDDTAKKVGNLTNKAVGIGGSSRVGGGKLVKKATSPRGAGATTPSISAKPSSKLTKKYY